MSKSVNFSMPFNLAKSYLIDIDRIWRLKKESILKYQEKCLRKIVRFAYDNVPLYHRKYKAANVYPSDIKKKSDIEKLPFINKDDLRVSSVKDILPRGRNKTDFFRLSTSGSTGKPVFVYWDRFSAVKSLEAYIRILKAYGGKWSKSKIALVIDLEPGSIENTMFSSSIPFLIKKILPMNNIKYIHIGEKPEDIIKELNDFSPEFLGSDPNMLRKLAVLNNEGLGKNLSLDCIFSGGSMLDEYTKSYVEKSFSTKIRNIYGATELGPLAFQCIKSSNYHIHSDYVLMEFLDEKNNPVKNNKPGSLVLTKLYGCGTPIIRYTGIEDFITQTDDHTSCGINTEMISRIEGRKADMIVLPNNKLLSPLTLTGIPAKIMEKYNTYKIKQFQIIQHKKDLVECILVFDNNLRDRGVSVKIIMNEVKLGLKKRLGKSVDVFVSEKDTLFRNTRSDYIKVVLSKVK